MEWPSGEFKIGINMAGAVSAGAYTAGVLDFLTEALAEWQTRKDALRAWLKNPVGPEPEIVPLHEVKIEVFSGASAGGMCAAIASVMVQQEFTHIRTAQETGTNNTFYEAWVNQVDIQPLLGTADLASGTLVSILDSTIIDRIAKQALTPGPALRRPYISEGLTLFLTLTNVRGTPYQLTTDPDATVEEFIAYYGDKLQFETTDPGATPVSSAAKPLPRGAAGAGAWPMLQEAAKATGAFPLFLAPRILTRDAVDYSVPPWDPLCIPSCAKTDDPAPQPAFPAPPPKVIDTLNVDGGVTDNDPFQLAHDYLAAANPQATDCRNPRAADKANCAVVTVAPFPAEDTFNPAYNPNACSRLWPMLSKLATVLISQSRFLGESLGVLTSGVSFSRFMIAPSDDVPQGTPSLQCGLLGAFGGFFERSFRAHDFLLGRRNCQRFLETRFCLPVNNPVIQRGLTDAGVLAPGIQRVPAPTAAAEALYGKEWIPIIPRTGSASIEVTRPTPGQLATDKLDQIVDWIVNRLNKIRPMLLDGAPGILKAIAQIAFWPIIVNKIKNDLRDALTDALCPNIQGQNAADCKPKDTGS